MADDHITNYRVSFFGSAGVGKSDLVNRIVNPSTYVFQEQIKPTISAYFYSVTFNKNLSIQCADIGGRSRYHFLLPAYLRNAVVGVLCIDLTQDINKAEIEGKIKLYAEENECDGTVILVGTKSDHPDAKIDAFKSLQIEGVEEYIITSAKTGDGVNDLVEYIKKLCILRQMNQWINAKKKLMSSLRELSVSEYKLILIQKQLEELNQVVVEQNLDPGLRGKEIEKFSVECKKILRGEHQKVLKQIYKVAAVATVTVLAMMLGFSIGFCLGLWAGPGALITALIVGSVLATALGMAGGGVTVYSFFKPTKEERAINTYVKETAMF